LEQKTYHLEIESDSRNLITVEEFINYFAVELNLKEEKINGLLISITEAITNAIKHGNKSDKNKLVFIDVIYDDEFITIKVKDQGEGFNPNIIPDPTHPDNLLKDSGRGVYLMKIYMDEIKFNKTDNGMETILKMKIN
jgi:serine/threonine-protein kinase RsbW